MHAEPDDTATSLMPLSAAIHRHHAKRVQAVRQAMPGRTVDEDPSRPCRRSFSRSRSAPLQGRCFATSPPWRFPGRLCRETDDAGHVEGAETHAAFL